MQASILGQPKSRLLLNFHWGLVHTNAIAQDFLRFANYTEGALGFGPISHPDYDSPLHQKHYIFGTLRHINIHDLEC